MFSLRPSFVSVQFLLNFFFFFEILLCFIPTSISRVTKNAYPIEIFHFIYWDETIFKSGCVCDSAIFQ